MSYLNKRFKICLATQEDDAELLTILEEFEMPGHLKIVYTRRPSPYLSFKNEGDEVGILICRDFKKNCIVSLGAYAIRKSYLNNQPSRIAYLFALRSLKRYRNRFPLKEGYDFLKNHLPSSIEFIYSSIPDGNFGAIKLFQKQHFEMPKYQKLLNYVTICLNQNKIIKYAPRKNNICKAKLEDALKVYSFFKKNSSQLNGFPIIEIHDLININSDKYIAHYYVCFDKNQEIKGVMRVNDTSKYKQYLVSGYSRQFKVYQLISRLLPWRNHPSLPKVGQYFKTSFIENWVIENQNEELLLDFIEFICNQKEKIPFLIIGVASDDFYYNLLNKFAFISYQSTIYQISWPDRIEQTKIKAPFYFECSSL